MCFVKVDKALIEIVGERRYLERLDTSCRVKNGQLLPREEDNSLSIVILAHGEPASRYLLIVHLEDCCSYVKNNSNLGIHFIDGGEYELSICTCSMLSWE
jgi:hypothetical protein